MIVGSFNIREGGNRLKRRELAKLWLEEKLIFS